MGKTTLQQKTRKHFTLGKKRGGEQKIPDVWGLVYDALGPLKNRLDGRRQTQEKGLGGREAGWGGDNA